MGPKNTDSVGQASVPPGQEGEGSQRGREIWKVDGSTYGGMYTEEPYIQHSIQYMVGTSMIVKE